MPEQATVNRARRAKRKGKAPTTQAGEFVREEIHHVREGKHGARSPEQAIAIGLSKARRSGVKLGPPPRGSRKTKQSARRAAQAGRKRSRKTSPRRSRAVKSALKRERRSAASPRALSRQAKRTARRRAPAQRRAAAREAARTKGPQVRRAAARKAARTRQTRRRRQSA